MARGPRLDAPQALHHVRARGIERRPIFYDDHDREDFLDRLGKLASRNALDVYAWALMPNHVHLLVRTVEATLERSMRSLLAGYATRFNRRHVRAGHLFQNRYKSTLCEDDAYFLKLVKYIHLNPIPSVIPNIAALANYAYTGHSVLLGATSRPWQETKFVLAQFANHPARAVALYEAFIRQSDDDPHLDLEGGGILQDGRYVSQLAKGRECFSSNERILGTPSFVDTVVKELDQPGRLRRLEQDTVIRMVCDEVGVEVASLLGGGRSRAVSGARRGIAFIWIAIVGGSGRALAARLGLNPASVYEAARRGREEGAYWSSIFHAALREPDKP